MSRKLFLLLLLLVTYADASSNLSQMPQPMLDFNINGVQGQWFVLFRSHTCHWSSARDYPNMSFIVRNWGPNLILMHLTWGVKGFCNNLFAKEENVSPGVYIVKGGFANLIEGKDVVVGTDYKQFLVYWTCPAFSARGECLNPYVTVISRTPTPKMMTIANINSVLMTHWGLTVNDLDPIQHTGHCVGSRMKKMYY